MDRHNLNDLMVVFESNSDQTIRKHLRRAIRHCVNQIVGQEKEPIQRPLPTDYPAAPPLMIPNSEELNTARLHGKIPAIKAFRTRTGADLLTAKRTLEIEMAAQGLGFGPATCSKSFSV